MADPSLSSMGRGRANAGRTLAALLSGGVWGVIGTAICALYLKKWLWGGLVVSPLIGLLIGWALTHVHGWRFPARAAASLVGLYVAVALFGLAAGTFDVLAHPIPNRKSPEAVLEIVIAMLWGLTFLSWLVPLWPLAMLNERWLARFGRA